MIDIKLPRYGDEFVTTEGWIAELGKGAYRHKFGGEAWRLSNPQGGGELPTLLLTIDFTDPKLSMTKVTGVNELPLFSHVNSDIWLQPQIYQIEPESKVVTVIESQACPSYYLESEDRLPVPLPEKCLTLRPMKRNEVPSDEESFWQACDSFLGGASFIRIAGPPVWLQYVERHHCSCARLMDYICSIGYESYDQPSGIITDKPFFIGEAALYFFLCKSCLKIKVTSQSS